MTCTFFGHRDTPAEIKPLLREVLLDLIEQQRIKQFYIGNNGNFDSMVRSLLSEFERTHGIQYVIVLAYLPKKTDPFFEDYTMLPDGIENIPRRFAIDYRNRWLIDHTDVVVTYVAHNFGGASKFKAIAEKKQKVVIELYKT